MSSEDYNIRFVVILHITDTPQSKQKSKSEKKTSAFVERKCTLLKY